MIVKGLHRARFRASSHSSTGRPPVEPPREKPSWISDTNLGSIDEEVEVTIPLAYNDPHAEVQYFSSSGNLPTGLYVNYFDGTIHGTAEVAATETFNFTVTMHTATEAFSRNFTLHVIANDTEIVWQTLSDLGEVDSGAGFAAVILAEQVKK